MNKKDYISNLFRKILKEDLEEKAESLMNKLNYDETLKLNKNKEFDYVQSLISLKKKNMSFYLLIYLF
jgi:hypothetical protein